MAYYFPQQRQSLKMHIIKAAVRLSFYKGLGGYVSTQQLHQLG